MPRKGQTGSSIGSAEKLVARVSHLPEITWARLAAFVDGEGTIVIGRTKPSGRSKSPMYSLRVAIGHTDPRLINWLGDNFGGHIGDRPNSSSLSRKPTFLWAHVEIQAAVILRFIRPYLICKKEQADIGIAFSDLKHMNNARRLPLTQAMIAERDAFYQKMSKLNTPPMDDVQVEGESGKKSNFVM